MSTEENPQPRPLEGITVLDLGQVYGGPYCAHLLLHLGARVIKIESPGRGEPLRANRAAGAGDPVGFQLVNGGKASVALDLKSEEGHQQFLALVEDADVVIENFAPGTAESLGVDFETLRALNPRIIYASLKAYSDDSPHRTLRGMDLTIQASSGVMSVNGFPDGPPVRCGPSLVDFLGGSHLALGVVAALMERGVTGRGQHVDVSLQDAVLPTLTSNFAAWLTDPTTAFERTGNRHGGMRESPYNVYATADGWVAILCISEPQWRGLCELIDRPDLRDDPTLASNHGRAKRMLEIDDVVTDWTKRYDTVEAVALLQGAGVPCAQLKTVLQVIDDESTRPVPMLRHVSGENGQETYTFGSPVRLSEHQPLGPLPVSTLGAQNDGVLGTLNPTSRGSRHGR
jgi:crotonobetainyl-CoA:carnitine CoA-transferase CaiB-like acyl-CoA transferase